VARQSRTIGILFTVCGLLFLMMAAFVNPADAWWNDNWQYRKKITLDTTSDGADISEGVGNVPVLIRLHTGNFNFTNAKENGEDIRFVGSDDQTLLKHHIERYDTFDEIALVWVKVPRLPVASKSELIYMYYGNKEAMGGQDSKGTYDGAQVVVYHLDEVEGAPKDRTANENHASDFSGGQGLPSVIGNGISLNGAGDKMVIPASPTLDFKNGFTFSTWIRMVGSQSDAYLLAREQEDKYIIIGIEGTKLYCRFSDEPGQTVTTERLVDISLNTWHQIAVSAAPNRRLSVYLDGLELYFVDLKTDLPGLDSDIVIGDSLSGEHALVAELDEVTLSNTARSAGWVKAVYASEGLEGRLCTFGVEMVGGGGGGLPIFYLSTIFKNITLDGWIIIGLLVLLGVFSWIVILSKSLFLIQIQRDDKVFQKAFASMTNWKILDVESEEFGSSTLFHVYKAGVDALHTCFDKPAMVHPIQTVSGNPTPKTKKLLNRKGMNVFKSSLERGFIEESKRFNAWLLVLTLAISGGPFLGLLGTVWGVMNTFAAMAEAGEANIMAIAPGVASALSTTVFGLIVAIPALFGYNFLTGKIKNMAADLAIFIDQYTLKVEENHGADE
jgi:biopolymer transport protein ExbB